MSHIPPTMCCLSLKHFLSSTSELTDFFSCQFVTCLVPSAADLFHKATGTGTIRYLLNYLRDDQWLFKLWGALQILLEMLFNNCFETRVAKVFEGNSTAHANALPMKEEGRSNLIGWDHGDKINCVYYTISFGSRKLTSLLPGSKSSGSASSAAPDEENAAAAIQCNRSSSDCPAGCNSESMLACAVNIIAKLNVSCFIYVLLCTKTEDIKRKLA